MDKNKYFSLNKFFKPQKAHPLLHVNPTDNALRIDVEKSVITVFEYDENSVEEFKLDNIGECVKYKNTDKNIWINVEGLKREEVKAICRDFDIHLLIEEDILSVGQRPKTDLFEDFVFCLLYMLSYDQDNELLNKEQISLILGKKFVLTFQEEPNRDAFGKVRTRLKNLHNKQLQQYGSDFLYYVLIDAIVDDYFIAMDIFGEKIEQAEELIVKAHSKISMSYILFLRKELLLLRRSIYPARDAISSINKNENELFSNKTLRYLKDIYDHILQATEMVENYREGMANLQDLHLNQANLKMNESMKIMAIVTCLLAPAAVIGGIFGMNFSQIPFLHDHYGFYFSVAVMLLIPLWMIYVFKKKGWF